VYVVFIIQQREKDRMRSKNRGRHKVLMIKYIPCRSGEEETGTREIDLFFCDGDALCTRDGGHTIDCSCQTRHCFPSNDWSSALWCTLPRPSSWRSRVVTPMGVRMRAQRRRCTRTSGSLIYSSWCRTRMQKTFTATFRLRSAMRRTECACR